MLTIGHGANPSRQMICFPGKNNFYNGPIDEKLPSHVRGSHNGCAALLHSRDLEGHPGCQRDLLRGRLAEPAAVSGGPIGGGRLQGLRNPGAGRSPVCRLRGPCRTAGLHSGAVQAEGRPGGAGGGHPDHQRLPAGAGSPGQNHPERRGCGGHRGARLPRSDPGLLPLPADLFARSGVRGGHGPRGPRSGSQPPAAQAGLCRSQFPEPIGQTPCAKPSASSAG